MSKQKRINVAKFALLLISTVGSFDVIAASDAAASITAKEMIVRSEARYKGDDMVSILAMTLTNKQGKERHRELLWYHREQDGLSIDLQKFYYPRNIKNVATLSEEVPGEDNRQFLYLPAAKKLRRVSSKNQSWVGSDFIYEDLQDIKFDQWQYRYIGNAVVDGFDTKIIEMKATENSDSSYSKRHDYVRTDGSYFPIKIEFFDKEDNLIKEVLRQNVHEYDSALYANRITVNNSQDGHRTELKRRWIKINTRIPAALMSSRQMEKSIEKYRHPQNMLKLARALEGNSNK